MESAEISFSDEQVKRDAEEEETTILPTARVSIAEVTTLPVPATQPQRPLSESATMPVPAQRAAQQGFVLTRGKALIGITLLLLLVFNATSAGYAQFLGGQGWGIVLGGPDNS